MLFGKHFSPYFLIYLVMTAQAALFARHASTSIYEDLEDYTQALASLSFRDSGSMQLPKTNETIDEVSSYAKLQETLF